MKKYFLVFVICAFLMLTGCGNKKFDGYHEITYKEYLSLIDKKASFPLVVGSSTCSACALFKPTMEKFISKYQVDVRYIDLSKLSEDDKNKLLSDLNVKSTPTTLFIEKGEQTSVYYRLVGSETFSNVVDSFKKRGYIKGE